jgi:hypothetical protein
MAYESARFGQSVDDAQQLPELFRDIALENKAKYRKSDKRVAAG